MVAKHDVKGVETESPEATDGGTEKGPSGTLDPQRGA